MQKQQQVFGARQHSSNGSLQKQPWAPNPSIGKQAPTRLDGYLDDFHAETGPQYPGSNYRSFNSNMAPLQPRQAEPRSKAVNSDKHSAARDNKDSQGYQLVYKPGQA